MEPEVQIEFRNQLRAARAIALRDAENFHELLFCIERLGQVLTKKVLDLGNYRNKVEEEAARSALAEEVPELYPDWHMPFSKLYDLVRNARNDALHQGAFARHLTNHAIQLALVLEDALMSGRNLVRDFMVRDPVCAYPWQPVSFVRQQMLANAFTYLPIYLTLDEKHGWYLISDCHVAKYLRCASSEGRKTRLVRTVEDAIASGRLSCERAQVCSPDTRVESALKLCEGRPILVVLGGHTEQLLGILAPFDVL